MSTSTSLQKLIQIPICKGLSAAEAKAVFDIAEELSVARGTHVFEEGDPGDGVYVLLEGAAEIVKQEQTLAKLSDGSVIGEMSLISGNAARSATAIATTDCRLLKISSQRFSRLLEKDDVAALKIVHNMAQVMSRRMLLMTEKIVELMDKDKGKRKEELAEFQKVLSNWSF